MLQEMGNRILTFIILLLFAGLSAGAQDIILKKTGEEIKAIVVDVSPGVVKYKKFENQQGPIFAIAREQVDKIIYQSGKAQDFEEETPEPITPMSEEQAMMPAKASPILGFHMGFGASNLKGEITGSKTQLASTLGATFQFPVGNYFSFLLGIDLLSIGCGFEDIDYIDHTDSSRIVITNAREDLGYFSLILLPRVYLNKKRNFFVEGGVYGSVLFGATMSGEAEITYASGEVESGAFSDEINNFYKVFDFGVAAGGGGRIPIGKKGKWHITAGARMYWGLSNIIDTDIPGFENYTEFNIYGLVFVGADLQLGKSK